jgi:hypothetical protein
VGGLTTDSYVRVTDAKEVGVGNPAEETFYHPNTKNIANRGESVKALLCESLRQAPGAAPGAS